MHERTVDRVAGFGIDTAGDPLLGEVGRDPMATVERYEIIDGRCDRSERAVV